MSNFSFQDAIDSIREFRDERDWRQFHTPKEIMLALMIEAAELGELAQWKSEEEIRQAYNDHPETFEDEVIDVLYWALLFASDLGIDLEAAFRRKMRKNAEKYPVELAKGSKAKYNQLSGKDE